MFTRLLNWGWRRLAPGRDTVWISSKRLIAMQQKALRVVELEREGRDLRARHRAHELIDGHCREPLTALARRGIEALLADLPLTSTGLHEPAFLGLLERQLWESRMEAALADVSQEDGS